MYILQFPIQLVFPFAWDASPRPRDISLGSREILLYSPLYYSYRRALQKLGKNTTHNNDWRSLKNYTDSFNHTKHKQGAWLSLGERWGCFRLSWSFKASHRPPPLQNPITLQTLWYPEEHPGQLSGFVFHNRLFPRKGTSRQVGFLCKHKPKGTAQLHLWPYSKAANSYRWFW
jgi:hypothetical protein